MKKKPITLSEHMSRIKREYWATRTPEERSAHAKKAVAAREAKRAAKKVEVLAREDRPECMLANGILICRCGGCKAEDYPPPKG